MADLVEWLNGQLDADEAIAQAADRQISEHGWHDGGGMCTEEWDHIEAFDPAHVLRTIAAHRAILGRYRALKSYADRPYDEPRSPAKLHTQALELAVREIAAIYESRPGFDPSWIPEDR